MPLCNKALCKNECTGNGYPYSVQHYINIINNGSAYEKYRELRDNGIEDSLQYVETLGAYAADKKYFPKLKSIIKKLREDYDIPKIN